MIYLLLAILFTTFLTSSEAFLSPSHNQGFLNKSPPEKSGLQLSDVSEVVTAAASSVWLATIDSDIAAIPENEFASVFAGGIAVMVGGVLSTFIVGMILDNGDLYASLAAESYLQQADDEEFWKGLSEEEKVLAETALNKIKESRGEIVPPPKHAPPKAEEPLNPAISSTEEFIQTASKEEEAAPKDVFSDY